MDIVAAGLSDGRHNNLTDNPGYFTTAYFHLPSDLAAELDAAGFTAVEVLGVEGIGWIARDFADRLDDPTLETRCSRLIRTRGDRAVAARHEPTPLWALGVPRRSALTSPDCR